MSSIGDFLFGSDPTPQVSKSTTGQTPAWYQAYQKALIQKASDTANTPYTANPNQQVAPLSADQNQAYSQVEQMQGAQQPQLNQANQYATSAGTGAPTSAQLDSYLNPYTNDVVNTIGTLAQRNLSENLLPAVNDTFTGAGQFGSSRHGDFTENAVRDANESALNAQSAALQSGFQNANTNYQADQSRQLQAANSLGSLAQTGQQVGLTGAAALESAGQAQQAQGQKNLDVLNQNWQNQQDYDKNNVSWLSGILNNSSTPTTTTTSTTPSTNNPSGLSSIVGAVGGIGSLIGSLFAEGGAVDVTNITPMPKKSKAKPQALKDSQRTAVPAYRKAAPQPMAGSIGSMKRAA